MVNRRLQYSTAACVIVGGAVSFACGALAQPPANYTPRVEAVRIDKSEAPKIDGDLSDPVWQKANVIETFYQVEPVEGGAPSQETKAYILYDQTTLYVGVYAYDTEPDAIRRSLLERDPPIQDDDAVRIIIDSYGTFRDGYFFATNANGARSDALVENNSNFRDEWNTIWNVKASVVEDGWIAEFAIPFQSISFDSSIDDWGFQIVRTIRRVNEEVRWSNIDRSRNRIDLTNPGRLSGIRDIKSGIGLEAQLFVTGSGSYDWELDETNFDFSPSGNLFYKITPSLTGSLTFNTDFSDAPLDSRQVNTGRFSLFFPETRDFFLQDANVFEFGGRIYRGSVNGLPFFSRRIGIVGGQPVDIVAGAKLSGKAGPFNVGLISAQTGSVGNIDGQLLSAARFSIPVLTESKAGIVLTNGDPAGGADNTVAGADFQYKNSSRWPGTFNADFVYQRSFDDGVNGAMAGADIAYRSLKWNWTARLRDIGEDYRPRLGFANRTGIRRYNANFWRAYRPTDSFIRFAETGIWTNVITDRNDRVLDRYWGAWAGGSNNDGDELWLNYERGFLDIRAPFQIAGVVPVAVGEYTYNQYSVEIRSTQSRPFSLGGEIQWGGIYGGDLLSIEIQSTLRPNRHLSFSGEYEYTEFSLPGGEIGIHIATLASTIAFSPTMTIKTDIQYDNISENFTFFSRFRWEPRPDREIFLSFGHSAIIDDDRFPQSFRAQGSNLSLRLGHNFRF